MTRDQELLAVIKLQNGIELIGMVTKFDEHTVTVRDAFQIIQKFSETSIVPTVYLSKYMLLTTDREYKFKEQDILTVGVPMKALSEYYPVAREYHFNTIVPHIEQRFNSVTERAREPTESELYREMLEQYEISGAPN